MEEKLNLYQKISRIAAMAGLLQRTKAGHNYKYVPEEDIQAKVTAGCEKFGVLLTSSISPGTLTITPIVTKAVRRGTEVEVYETIVSAEMTYTWINTDNPYEQLVVPWALVGQMADASQAFGAGTTYCNRYFLMKSLQLATTEDDPDTYRSKQKTALEDDDKNLLATKIREITEIGSKLISQNVSRDDITKIVAEANKGDGNPLNIKLISVADKVLNTYTQLLNSSDNKKKE